MKKIIFFLISLGFFIPGCSFATTQNIHIEWTYDYEPTEERTLAGYYLYQEGVKICTNNTPTDRTMDCTFESEAGTFNFTLTAFCTDGYESPHSSPYTFTLTAPSDPALLAAFTNIPTFLSGDTPFTVSFDASNSTGDITSYSWNFGDNSDAIGRQANHTYTTEGTFNATLSVTSSNGETSQKSVAVHTTIPQSPPSTHNIYIEWTYDYQPEDGRILAGYYLYKEGTKICTNNSPTDRAMDCIFESEDGTFDFTLTAFCTDGFESPHSSPYTFTLGTNSDPELTANFDTTPTILSGDTPFTVFFNASASNGDITSYSWNFGDNNFGNGTSTSYTYTAVGTFSAILTVTSSNGATSQKSVIVTTTAPPVPPVAIIAPDTFTGDAPLTISFDGSASTSTVSYAWFFGDGATANNSHVNHTFTTAGTFIATLTVTNAQGQTHSTNTTVTVNEVVAENTSPTAVINSSTAMGDAPLSISFDGTGSHDTEGTISSYLWNFGDGSQATTAATATHAYTVAGTYSASLTVTDNQGATDTTSTPVIITGQTVYNQSPTARLTASMIEGTTPLEVIFDGSTSTDPENAPLTYNWNFGDGSSGQGVTVSHIYTSPGSFNASLTVTDDFGAISSSTTTINAGTETPEFKIELGEVEINHNWIRINFSDTFINPIVVTGAPSKNDSDPCVVRLRNITSTGFDIRIQEWSYLDSTHAQEIVAYFVIEQGNFALDDGTMIKAGQFTSTDTNFKTVQFNTAFTVEPVVMTSIATFNEDDTVTGRLKNISTTSFDHKTQEQQLANGHGNEKVNYIAWEPTQTTIGNIAVIVDKTADKVKHRWYNVNYGKQLSELPIFLGTMQSQDGRDPSAIRYTNKTDSGIQVMVEEEQSADDETRHTSETIGYFLFSPNTVDPEPSNQPPSAVITTDTTEGTAPLSVHFDGSQSTDPEGDTLEYQWDFGEGTTANGVTANHVFTESGVYTVTLTVTDIHGETSQSQVTVSTVAGESWNINFQPGDAPIPETFERDSGHPFDAARGYGWSTYTPNTRDRNNPISPDQSYDTNIMYIDNSNTWEISLPNGSYSVTICTGDPSYPSGVQSVQVEGVSIIDQSLSETEKWIEKTANITVSDNYLTITFQGSNDTKLCWLKTISVQQ